MQDFFVAAIFLRILLCWVNPSVNAFDNHFDPIYWIMDHGSLPPKDTLWQSYQPPVFYVISAIIGKMMVITGMPLPVVKKILQFIPCLYGIMTLGIIYLILKKVPLSDFSRLAAFGVICFLPRHIYMSAIHSNDTISGLGVAVCTYLMMVVFERRFSYLSIVLLSIGICLTVFTKYTAFVVIPMALSIIIPVLFGKISIPGKKIIISCLLLIVMPLFCLSGYFYKNIKDYGNPMPWNDTLMAPVETQARSESGISYIDFKPWESIQTPILVPSNLDSFWTLIYSRMWFDMEPKFIYFSDKNNDWWDKYFGWLRGEVTFPDSIPLSTLTHFTGSALIALGLVPLVFILIGAYRVTFGDAGIRKEMNQESAAGIQVFPVLFLFNAAGIIALAMKSPVFSSMKAVYFLGSLPAFAVFLGYGLMSCEKHRILKGMIIFVFGCLFALVAFHIVSIAHSLNFRLVV